jgi:hypothetical protein
VGLVKSRTDHISVVSPDAVCVLECTTIGLANNDESKLAGDIKKLSKFLSTTDEMVEYQDWLVVNRKRQV